MLCFSLGDGQSSSSFCCWDSLFILLYPWVLLKALFCSCQCMHLDVKENNLQEALQHMQILEKEIDARDAEIAQCKAHIMELNLHAEAQPCVDKQMFKALEAMIDQVKPEGPSPHATISSSSKLEKNGSKSRGSGSPFKCIELGLVRQIHFQRDEELIAGRLCIEELEALAAN